jgi:hypothetical protein
LIAAPRIDRRHEGQSEINVAVLSKASARATLVAAKDSREPTEAARPLRCDAFVLLMLGFGRQFLPPTVNQKALRSSSGNLAKFTANRRASSRVSRFGRRAMRRSDMSGIAEKRKCAACA